MRYNNNYRLLSGATKLCVCIMIGSIILWGASSMVMPANAAAACGESDPFCLNFTAWKGGITQAQGTAPSVAVALGRIVQVLLSFTGVLFFLLILWAGFRWMVARGNQEDVEASKKTIENAAVGLVIVIVSYALTTYIVSNLFSSPAATPPPGGGPPPASNPCEQAGNHCEVLNALGDCPVSGIPPLGLSCGSTGLSCCAP